MFSALVKWHWFEITQESQDGKANSLNRSLVGRKSLKRDMCLSALYRPKGQHFQYQLLFIGVDTLESVYCVLLPVRLICSQIYCCCFLFEIRASEMVIILPLLTNIYTINQNQNIP